MSTTSITSFLFALSAFWFVANGPLKAELPYRQEKNVVYAEVHGVGLVMDIFAPAAQRYARGIVQVVSGGWFSDRGKIRELTKAQVFDTFCRRGYTVFAVRPGSVSKFSAPEMVQHLETGIRWIKQRAQQYQIAPDRLGLIGASAGGHLGSLVAVRNGISRGDTTDVSVAAAGIFFPPTDFHDYGGRKIDPTKDGRFELILRSLAFPDGVTGMTEQQIEQAITDVSPAKLVTENTPPFLLFHGDADSVVPLQQSRVLLEALRKHNVPARLVIKPGGGHPWPTIHEEVTQLADWFDERLSPDEPVAIGGE